MHPYIPITEVDREEMLASIGAGSIEELFEDIPEVIRLGRKLELPDRKPEMELRNYFRELSMKNGSDYLCFRGAGAYRHYIPSIIGHIVSRSEFYTAYTPYQPEVSQGILQAIFEYQTMICELTGMDVSNASVYDGATAAAEAVFMAADITGRSKVLLPLSVSPDVRRVISTYCKASGIEVVEAAYSQGLTDINDLKSKLDSETAAVVVQSPNFFGCIEPCRELFESVHASGAAAVMHADPISLGMLESPAELGADIAVGDGQPLGNPLNFGGPYLGFMAVREKHMRRLPGRIVGETVDRHANRGFVLTLQAREQHIRREKASSNICTNQALNALTAAVYLSIMGSKGLKKVAELCMQKSYYAAQVIAGISKYSLAFGSPFFREFVVKSSSKAGDINLKLMEQNIIGGYELENDYPELKNHMLFCVTEIISKKDIDNLVNILGRRGR